MNIDLQERIAIVSGSTSGIGFGIARALAESGATVVVNGCSTAGRWGRRRNDRLILSCDPSHISIRMSSIEVSSRDS